MKQEAVKRKWTGKWIEPEQENAYLEPELSFEQMVEAERSGIPGEEHLKCAKHLHRVVRLESPDGQLPVSAVIYASAHGVYDLYINGKKADDRLLAPETTNYRKLIWYQIYDVSELISESDRACVDVLLGDGWWIGRLGMAGSSCNYGDRLGFIMDLELIYPDGSSIVIGSDEQFVSCDSFIRYSDLYIGEMQDGRAFDFIDAAKGCPPRHTIMNEEYELLPAPEMETFHPVWTPCICAKYPTDVLTKQMLPPVRVLAEIPMKEYVITPGKELVADFGQVLAGTVRICVSAKPGTLITIEHGEVLDQDGNYVNNIKGLYKDQKVRYICAGGEQAFAPHFTYQGFRYVRISGVGKEEIISLTALIIGTPLEKLADFSTDNELLNSLETAIENSTVSNMISVPTDCPQREKLGWTGDINIFTGTGAFLFDLRQILSGWLFQVRMDQFPDGEIPVVVPNHPFQDKMQRGMSGGTNSSAAWSDCIVFMPLKLYEIYGDISFLEDNYDAMEKWMAYVEGQTHDYLWTGRFHFGDWLIPSLREEPDGVMKGVMATSDITGSCYYSLAISAMIRICAILNHHKKEEEYKELLEKVNRAIVNAYVREDGTVGPGPDDAQELQGLYVMILKTGAVEDPSLKQRILEHLLKLIESSGYTLDCGFSSVGFLLDVLYDNGYRDTAYKILFNTDAPSWLYMIKNGATSIWENWLAVRKDGTVTDSSYNHYAFGCVGEFLYRHIGGIEMAAPGFCKVRISPDLNCGLSCCSISRKLPGAGPEQQERRIAVQWSVKDASGCSGSIEIEIPEGVEAVLEIPSISKVLLPGKYQFDF